jgi:hypothetical protein
MRRQLKAVLVIEALTSEGEPANLELDVAMGRVKDKRLIELNKILTAVYKFAHVATNPSCLYAHKDWIKELELTYDAMHKGGLI